MTALTIFTVLFAVGAIAFGWQIAVKGEYYLVRGYKNGAERTARAVGALLLAGGLLSLFALPLMYFTPRAALPAFAAVTALTLIPMWVLVRKIK